MLSPYPSLSRKPEQNAHLLSYVLPESDSWMEIVPDTPHLFYLLLALHFGLVSVHLDGHAVHSEAARFACQVAAHSAYYFYLYRIYKKLYRKKRDQTETKSILYHHTNKLSFLRSLNILPAPDSSDSNHFHRAQTQGTPAKFQAQSVPVQIVLRLVVSHLEFHHLIFLHYPVHIAPQVFLQEHSVSLAHPVHSTKIHLYHLIQYLFFDRLPFVHTEADTVLLQFSLDNSPPDV